MSITPEVVHAMADTLMKSAGLPLIIQSLYRGHTKWSFREETKLTDRVLADLNRVKRFDSKFKAEVLGYRIITRRGTILHEEATA